MTVCTSNIDYLRFILMRHKKMAASHSLYPCSPSAGVNLKIMIDTKKKILFQMKFLGSICTSDSDRVHVVPHLAWSITVWACTRLIHSQILRWDFFVVLQSNSGLQRVDLCICLNPLFKYDVWEGVNVAAPCCRRRLHQPAWRELDFYWRLLLYCKSCHRGTGFIVHFMCRRHYSLANI